ncbi:MULTISPECIES: FAD-dependent oxidoreductase [unclassified Streptomyces]|uniref:FAD-dependent oxidoreductase n=1 Tax=unclassified Streptomyces TaxID=2593676 RepID=UPI0015D48249|nr:FAD-dependent oxidoreductase [Streptomyces sp. Ru87]
MSPSPEPRPAQRRSVPLLRAGRRLRIAVIGAGPAGLTSAKQALAEGHEVVLYEKNADVGGIWDPASGGAYPGVRMQSSRMSFPFSDHPPVRVDDFPTLEQVHAYLRSYAESFGVLPVCRFGHRVSRVVRRGSGGWEVTARHGGEEDREVFDAVMVASGELWEPRRPERLPDASAPVRVLTAKGYRGPREHAGRRVLVVGGGVSGADIASELAGTASRVDWSVRRPALFLPRDCAGIYNDALFSYIGRIGLEEFPYDRYLKWLGELLPDYMAMYRATGLLPTEGYHGAVHINEKVIPRVYRGQIAVRPAFESFGPDGCVTFADGTTRSYDDVVLCLGYGMPDYGFLADFRQEDLYEHHFWRHDPTLMVINTPVDTEAFGTACPYFEAIAGWALAVLAGRAGLPSPEAMTDWCERHMSRLDQRRYFDCWLETIRIGLAAGNLPDPRTDFGAYWQLVSGTVAPSRLRPGGPAATRPAAFDQLFDMDALRHRVLASLPLADRDALLAGGRIGRADYEAALLVREGRELQPWLPYRQRESTAGAPVPG